MNRLRIRKYHSNCLSRSQLLEITDLQGVNPAPRKPCTFIPRQSGAGFRTRCGVKKISFKDIRKICQKVLSLLGIPSKKVSFVFCDERFIKKLNKKFFQKFSATDVISFPLKDEFNPNYLGEVVVSVEEAVKAAAKYGGSWKKELTLYLIHGILHLVGYSDTKESQRRRIERKQSRILKKIIRVKNLGWLKKT